MDELIYSDLVSATAGIGKKAFLGRRPKTLTEELSNFIVIELPTEIVGRIAGNIDVMQEGYGMISVFSKAKKDGTLNVHAHSTLVQQVTDLFKPSLRGKYITARKPRRIGQGEDGYGYQYSEISFFFTTKLNAQNIV